MPPTQPILRFQTHHALAHRLTLSTLTGRPLHISEIRPSSPLHPGLAPHEISLLRLLEAVTNGTRIEISYTGTILVYRPGLITGSPGGDTLIRHDISAECARGVAYFLIPLALLAPFSKEGFNVLLTGPGCVTAATPLGDASVDTFRTAILPLYAKFGVQRNIEIKVLQRSNCAAGDGRGGGHGEVQLRFGHQVRVPRTLHFVNAGRVKRIRGVAAAVGVAGGNNARMIEAARGVLNPFCHDTYVFSDVSAAPLVAVPSSSSSSSRQQQKPESASKRRVGLGFGLSLVAESSTGALYSADATSPAEGGQAPEEVGRMAALLLLESVERGGCVPLEAVSTVMVLMAMGSEDVGRVLVGKGVVGHAGTVRLARDLREFGFNGWGIRDEEGEGGEGEAGEAKGDIEGGNVVVSVVGGGIGNVARKMG